MTNFKSDKVVTVEYLKSLREKNDVVIIDARGNMLEEGALMYDKAIVVDWTDISLLGEFGGEELGKLLSKENYKEIFKLLNINENTEVLAYGFTMPEAGFGDEGRIVYTFEYAGLKNVKFVDGGFNLIEQLGFNKTYIKDEHKINTFNINRQEAENNYDAIFTEELLDIYNNENVQVLDTRLAVEYNGRVIYGENRAGHIPNSISVPFNSFVDNNGLLKSNEEINNYLSILGVDKNKLIITYCTTGVRASYVAVILKELGYKVRNYEPSFARYANIGEVTL